MFEWKNRRLTATSVIRSPERAGGPTLVMADDHRYYWAKVNSESRRDATHEAAAWCAATAIGLSTPVPALIDLSLFPEVLQDLGAVSGATLAYGSCLHGDGTFIYDFLPKNCFEWVENLDETVQWAAFDVWIANAERNQPVFSRSMAIQAKSHSLRALKISHAQCFEGFQAGSLTECPKREIDRYQAAAGSFDPTKTVDAICSLSAEELRAILAYAPKQLLDDCYRARLLEGLLVRQAQLPDLIVESYSEALTLGSAA